LTNNYFFSISISYIAGIVILKNSVSPCPHIDKFGEDVKTYAYSLSSFKAEVEVATSHVFFGWIFGLGGRVVINGPQRVKDEYEKMVRDAAANLSLQLCERLK